MAWVATAVFVGSTVYSTVQKRKAAKEDAKQQEAALKFNSAQNITKAGVIRKVGAEDAFQLRRDLRRQLARNRVATAGAGVLPSTGTPLDTALLNIRDAASDIATLEENTRLAAAEPELLSDLQLLQARGARRAGVVNARTAITQGAASITGAISRGFERA